MDGRVLIVDDDAQVRRVLTRILQRAGNDVTVAANGEEAASLLVQRTFDVVLTDYSLGEVTGADLAEKLADRPSPPYIVLVTGYATEIDDPTLLSRGVNAVLPKPCRGDDLRQVLARVHAESPSS